MRYILTHAIHPKLWRWFFLLLLVVLCYLSFKPNPAIQEERWMPETVTAWFDMHDQWKNFIGFWCMGFAGFMTWPRGVKGSKWALWALMTLVIVVMELIQIPIPRRWFDFKDIAAGGLGILAAWPCVEFVRRLITPSSKTCD